MTVYRAEVKWTDVVVTGVVGDVFNTTTAAIAWTCREDTIGYGMIAGIQHHSFGAGPTDEWRAFFSFMYNHSSPFEGTLVDFITEADGANGAGYFTGGLMSIEKDTVSETVTWSCPLGSVTKTFAELDALGPLPDDSPLLVAGMGHQLIRVSDPTDEKVRWLDFHVYQGDEDTPYHGADLTSADPGVWSAWIWDSGFDGSGIEMVDDDQQLSNGYQTRYSWTATDDVPDFRQTGSRETRGWNQPLTETGVDLTRAEPLSQVFAALVLLYQPHRLRSRRSYDGGRNWETGIIHEQTGVEMERPSISWWNGKLIAVWNQGTDILQAVSYTTAREWEVPTTLPYTGTFPRHIVYPGLGLYLYFFFDATTLKVVRSSDAGTTFWDAAPITVETGINAQQIDAEVAYDGSILVTYFDGGAWTQKRSFNGGLNWE